MVPDPASGRGRRADPGDDEQLLLGTNAVVGARQLTALLHAEDPRSRRSDDALNRPILHRSLLSERRTTSNPASHATNLHLAHASVSTLAAAVSPARTF